MMEFLKRFVSYVVIAFAVYFLYIIFFQNEKISPQLNKLGIKIILVIILFALLVGGFLLIL